VFSCWICLAPYDLILRDGNHRHYAHCKHYAPYDEPKATQSVDTANVLSEPLEVSSSANQTNPVASTSTSTASHRPYTVESASVSAVSIHRSQASASPFTSQAAYQPPSYLAASTSTSQSTSQPLPYTAPNISNTGSTSKPAKKWYMFWKE
jgi:hypothetical protein